jgi:hypothetical protein
MSFFGKLFALSPSPAGLPQAADTVRAAIMAINRVTAPFQIHRGNPDEAELVAER